ncbi:ER lumen protein retaining receptor-domain-containing protein [Mycena maculata]|uniref:ER lumen protein-retaining receptor n=1 Tax=Mycena maculata TaxID=230809 RepID=A0AAD7HR82_9AGAR|nr:ER lumen protein retaining receptor-domain-containing protein [Mycena maculata]
MTLNIFRLLGDLSHLASILILVHKMQTTRSCRGISFKTQALYAGVFVARYLDLTFRWVSLYNFIMKLFFIASSCYILYIMRYRFRPTHDPSIDTFRIEYLLGPCVVLSLIFNYHFNFTEILWSFSIFLESVAILPQLFMLQRTGEAETITTHYLAALGAYRALYIPNWIYRYFSDNVVDPIAVTAGIVQTGLYIDFFYVYFTKVLQGQKFELPA